MINWYEIARISHVKEISTLIAKHMNVWVGILTQKGVQLELSDSNILDKPLCDAFLGRSDHLSCAVSYRDWFKELSENPSPNAFFECHAGLKGVASPILVDDEVVGAFYASGFLPAVASESNEAQIFRRAQELSINKTVVAHGLSECVRLQQREAHVLASLLEEMARVAMQHLGQRTEKEAERSNKKYDYSHIIGKSPAIKQLFKTLDKVVESESTVLIQGPPGVGKELVARAVHYNGPRADGPFVIQNCSALNDSLLDSELFGHKRGAFTGAFIDKAGLFEVADGGTFFLDEIGDMSPALQVKLLRVLQEGTFVPVGDSVTRRVDVRIVTATNKNLEQMVKDGTFRSDLYYRINVIGIWVPSLADRREDIMALVQHFIEKKCHENNYKLKRLSADAMRALMDYDWPGNVRELENEVERIVVLSTTDEVIPLSLLSPRITKTAVAREHSRTAQEVVAEQVQNEEGFVSLPDTLENIEKNMIYNALERNQWNKTRTAKELGVSRRNLIRKVDRYQLEEIREDAEKK